MKRKTALIVVLVLIAAVLILGWKSGYIFDLSRFFAAEPDHLSIQCGATQNVLTWTYNSFANSNSIERGNTGLKNLPNCADYWCWLPSINFPHVLPTVSNPTTYVDTQLQSGACYAYRIKYQPLLPSNEVFCPTNCNLPPATTPPPALCVATAPTGALSASVTGSTADLSWTPGSGGTYQQLRIGTDQGEVATGCQTVSTTCLVVENNLPISTRTYTAQDLYPGTTFYWRVVNVQQDPPDCFQDVTAQFSTTPTPPLSCAPLTQTVGIGQTASFTSAGESPAIHAWTAPDGNPSEGTGPTFETSYSDAGTFSVLLHGTEEGDVSCSVVVSATETATPTPTLTPTPTPLSCAPLSQTVAVGQSASFTAAGGTSQTYSWSSPESAPSVNTNQTYSATFGTTGTFTVTVANGVETASCQVVVTATPTPPPATTAALTVQKSVRNLTQGGTAGTEVAAKPGDSVEFTIRVQSTGSAPAGGVTLRDSLPAGLSYVTGSTTVDGLAVSDGIITSGISLGDLASGRIVFVGFRANVAPASFFSPGVTVLRNVVTATATGINASATTTVSSSAQVRVTLTPVGPITQVPTGPGQSAVLALIVSTIVTLLYVGYTATDAFRRHEATTLARGSRDDMPDFKR